MQMTLCHDCAQPFFDDKNYTVIRLETDPCDNECFICQRHGCNYEITKIREGECGQMRSAQKSKN
jgi:hypothetical protein